VRENHGTDPVLVQNAAAFGESLGHRLLEPCAVLGSPSILFRLILHGLAGLRSEGVGRVEGVAQQRMTRQCALQPDEEVVRKVGVGDSVIVRRVSEPNPCGLIGKRVLRSICGLQLSRARIGPRLNYLRDKIETA
jgi:hypothetical protein